MIDVVYTGDIRHSRKVRKRNHSLFFDRLKEHKFEVHEFYNGEGEKKFLPCPYKRGGRDAYWHPDNLRRGQGGGVQVWQFANAVRLT